MNRHLTTRAIERARWFSELSTALDDGERLLAELIAEKISPGDTERLRLRLIEVRIERSGLTVSLTDDRIVGSTWPDRRNSGPVGPKLPERIPPPVLKAARNGPIAGA